MDLLITLIGNAVVDPGFRKRFLDNPVDIMDHYRFRLTKGEFELMQTVFTDLEAEEKQKLEDVFLALQDVLYGRIGGGPVVCGHPPCLWSLCPPPELRAVQPKPGKLASMPKRTGTK